MARIENRVEGNDDQVSGSPWEAQYLRFFPHFRQVCSSGVAREMRELVPEFEKIFDFVIEEKMKQQKNKEDDDATRDVLDCLLELIGQEIGDGASFEIPQVKALLLDMITGGTDTISTMVEWVMMELLDHPDIINEVVEELMRVVGMDPVVEESHIHDLHYLQADVKEALRLHPALEMLIPRSPSRSCIIGGYEIPVELRVFLNVWSVQMDPTFWDSPSEFKPDRFLEANSNKLDYMGNNFGYLPFGSGEEFASVCIWLREW